MNKENITREFPYSHKEVEKKWQKYWEENSTFYTDLEDFKKPKKYVLPMFPYPSGSGLHVGHVRNYTITDAMARFYRMIGFNVLLVTGWDAFGLPSEQYAIKTNNHPAKFTYENIQRFKKQLISLGFSYDWSKEINTSEPNYYQWTQWIFKQIYQEGLAEYRDVPVHWCEELATVLSNEEVKNIDGKKLSERGSFPVVKKNISQWVLKITDDARALLDGLESLEWPLSIKNLQQNWIGLSKGANVKFRIVGHDEKLIEIFTTRPDTIYGVNAIAIPASSDLIKSIVEADFSKKVNDFCERWRDNDSGNSKVNEELLGEFTGSYCINPINGNQIPIWVTNFAIADFGTGSLMISPFSKFVLDHCDSEKLLTKKEIEQNRQIDYRFSKKFNLPITEFIEIDQNGRGFSYVNSPLIDGLADKELAIKKIIEWLEQNKFGSKAVSYHLKDWIFSRQRYWGEPIPVLHSEDGKIMLVSDDQLPLQLPHLTDFKPSKDYYSPLQKSTDWVNFYSEGLHWKRDVNVMPQWAGSCWYYIAFLLRDGLTADGKLNYLPLNSSRAKKIINHWLPVDLYVGGQEHANLHLLYARFWHHILNRVGVVDSQEPFWKLVCQGMVLGEGGEKMSKSKGNVINPDDFIDSHGSDSLRLYEVFVGPVDQMANFDQNGVPAMRRWLNRVYNLFTTNRDRFNDVELCKDNSIGELDGIIKEITRDYNDIKLNLVVAKLMKFVNKCYLLEQIPIYYGRSLLQMLNPLAPHITEEIWSFFNCESISHSDWPVIKWESKSLTSDHKLIIQINGKKRDIIDCNDSINEDQVLEIVRNRQKNIPYLDNKNIKKVIFVKGKLINLVLE